jgi:hypothetical protein
MLRALTGLPGAGKDSAALALCAWGWQRMAFADSLRLEVAAAWGLDVRMLTERRHKEATTPQLAAGAAGHAGWLYWAAAQGHCMRQPRSPRWAMQQWGDYRRAADPDHFVQPVAYWVQHQRATAARRGLQADLVVTDCRMGNEFAALRQLGGYLVRVHRPGASTLAQDTAQHTSEAAAAQLPADDDVHNDGSLLDLSQDVARVLRRLQARAQLQHQPTQAQA